MNEQRVQYVDLRAPIISSKKGKPPIVMKVHTSPDSMMIEGGSQQAPLRQEYYVLISALPQELRRRVEDAINTMVTGL